MKQIQQMGRSELGSWGEDIACQYLSDMGWVVLDRNWRTRGGELDVVAFDPKRQAVVAVEVKTRRTNITGTPSEAVDPQKLHRIRSLIVAWAIAHSTSNCSLEVDVLGVYVFPTGDYCVEHTAGVAP